MYSTTLSCSSLCGMKKTTSSGKDHLLICYNMIEASFSTGFNHLFVLNETGDTMLYHHCTLIASGVARLHGDLLLVQQSYPGDPHPYWGLPGGQVEPGEELLVGLGRELLEETGLTLVGTPTIAFVVQILRQTDEGHQQWLVCHFACAVEGT